MYQRDIEIPADWDGRDIFLRLEGAKSGVYVYVNGQEVGYTGVSPPPGLSPSSAGGSAVMLHASLVEKTSSALPPAESAPIQARHSPETIRRIPFS